jgi:DNA-binding winged helix-turn-helix (wHTH) protein/TolB-like protein/Tfp pilus assembly protein PilF
METVENKEVIYEFGRFALDPHQRILFSDGRPIHLPAKEFETLLLLVENNGRALSKEEMMTAIWKDAFVEEANLAKQISLLRKLLGSDGVSIETIPKRGYRFSADVKPKLREENDPVVIERKTVRRLAVEIAEEPDRGVKQLPGSRRWRSPWLPLVAGAVLLGLLGIAAYFWYSPRSPESAAAVKSVAVLPFRALGEDDQYLRLGLADALITKLGSLKRIVIRPTNAVGSYDVQDPLAAGRELGVEAVLHGNVQRVGEQVRVNLQLARVDDGALLWGGKFDEKFTNIFDVQDAISEQVARALEPGLTGEEAKLLAKHYTTNADAHQAYVRGRFYWNRRTRKDLTEAVGHFQEAIAKDPKYALAYAGLADTYSLMSDYNAARPAESYAKAKEAALKALELDSELAEGHTSLAYTNMYYFWDWAEVENRFRRAVALNPNYATAHHWYSEYLAAMGRFDEALVEIRRAKEIDPLSPVINAGEVWILYFARRYDEAIAQGRKLAEMAPEFAEVNEYLKRSYDQKGMYREAIAARQMRRKLAGYDPVETPALKSAASARSHQEYWAKRLEQELDDEKREGAENFDMAEIHAQLGNKDEAFAWLEKAFQDRDYLMIYLKVAPNLDPLRSDPRFAEMLTRVGLGA